MSKPATPVTLEASDVKPRAELTKRGHVVLTITAHYKRKASRTIRIVKQDRSYGNGYSLAGGDYSRTIMVVADTAPTKPALRLAGEDHCAQYLDRRGLKIVERDGRHADFVALDGAAIVFVTLTVKRHAAAVTDTAPDLNTQHAKNARRWLAEHPEFDAHPARLDSVCLRVTDDGELARVNHAEDVVA